MLPSRACTAASAGAAYANVQTPISPGGEIRGQDPNHRQIIVQTGCAIHTAIRRTPDQESSQVRSPQGSGRRTGAGARRSRVLLAGVGRVGRARATGSLGPPAGAVSAGP